MLRRRAFVTLVLGYAAFASAVPVSAQPRVPLAPTWIRPTAAWELAPGGGRLGRTLPPRPRGRHRPQTIVRNPSGVPYQIVDLGAPAGLVAPMPYAVDASGDVAVQYCATVACAVGNTSAYVYVAAMGKLVPLARFAVAGVGYTPYAIDAAGDRIVGWATFVSGYTAVDRPVQWTRTSMLGSRIAFLDADPHVVGRAYGISHAGKTIVGDVSLDLDGFGKPATFGNGGFTLLPTGSFVDDGDAFAVNDAGVVAGDIEGIAGLFMANTFEPFAFPDDPDVFISESMAIAENGDVAGNYVGEEPGGLPIYPVGYRYHAKLGPPSAGVETIVYGEDELTYVSDINDEDALVGETYPNNYATYVGPYLNGTPLADLLPTTTPNYPYPEYELATATAINDANDIVGQAYRADGSLSAFEMMPLPLGCTPLKNRPSCLGGRTSATATSHERR